MLFIHPMWDNESQRVGKQKCTPIGYALHGIAELIGFLGLVLLVVVLGILILKGVRGTFHASTLWLLTVPFGVGVVSEALYQFSWWLAVRKGWQYDSDLGVARWMKDGACVTFKYGSISTSDQTETPKS